MVPFVTPESHRSHGSGAKWRKSWDCGKVRPQKVFGRTSKSCRGYSWKQQWDQEKLQTDSQLPHTHTHTQTHTVMEEQDSRLSAGCEPRTIFDIFHLCYLGDSLCNTSFGVSGNCSSEKLGNVPTVTQPVNDWDRIGFKSSVLFTLYEPFYTTCDSTFQ